MACFTCGEELYEPESEPPNPWGLTPRDCRCERELNGVAASFAVDLEAQLTKRLDTLTKVYDRVIVLTKRVNLAFDNYIASVTLEKHSKEMYRAQLLYAGQELVEACKELDVL